MTVRYSYGQVILFVTLLLPSIKTHTSLNEPVLPIKRLHQASLADTGRYNFVVAVLFKFRQSWSFRCGGSIVAPRKIVTAAHCVFDSKMTLPLPRMVAIVAGDKSWTGADSGAVIGHVAAIYSHENFRSPLSEPDLALLILKEDLPIDNRTIGMIELSTVAPKDGQQCVALGWGLNEEFHISSNLMAATFEIQPIDACILFYGVPSPNLICGMSNGKSSVCTGDSGGPLICGDQLTGIIDSSGINCSATKPSLFTAIRDYVTWIKRERNLSASTPCKMHYFVVFFCWLTS